MHGVAGWLGASFFMEGTRIDETSFPSLPQVGLGRGRLRANARSLGDATIVDPSQSFCDTKLGVECSPRTSRDGVVRCFAPTLAQEVRYTDSACTKPVYAMVRGLCGQTARYVELENPGSGPPSCWQDPTPTRVMRIGAPYVGDLYAPVVHQGCQPAGRSDGLAMFLPGEATDVSIFAETPDVVR